ncbi:MAG: hypothetical protein ACFFAS_12870 [Promethearchaeota archaeon]
MVKVYNKKAWKEFYSELDDSLVKIYERFPIMLFSKGWDSNYDMKLDKWHDWSTSTVPSIIYFLSLEFQDTPFQDKLTSYRPVL